MSEQQLTEILEQGDSEACVAYFKDVPEKQRRELAPLCRKWFNKIQKNDFIETSPGSFSPNPLMPAAEAALFATATLSELKKLAAHRRPQQEVVYQLLIDRRPNWVRQWVPSLLDEEYYWVNWTLVRRLVAAGLADRPDHPNYYQGMISGIAGSRGPTEEDASLEQCLLDDPGLLDDEVWRLFEYDGAGENSLANFDRFSWGGKWSDALLSLMNAGRLPRERLLSCSLDALDRDFNHYRAKWFAAFYDALKASPEETADHAPRYLRLLGVSAPNIVSWAFKKVERLAKTGAYDAGALIAGLQPVLQSRQKGIVKKALALLAKTAKQSPDASRDVALAAVTALGHEAADVQEAAMKIIDQTGTPGDGELVAAMAEYAEIVAPSLRDRLAQWIGAVDDGTASMQPAADDRPVDLEGLDPALREIFGIDALLDHIEHGRVAVPAASFDGTDISRLDPAEQLTPIEDLDELIDVCARVIEDESLADDAERAMDGLSRLCDQRPDDFPQRVGPLLKRATHLLKEDMAPFRGMGPDSDLCGLVYTWGTGTALPAEADAQEEEGEQESWTSRNLKKAIGFLSRRSLALAERIAVGKAAPLLGAPTHSGGWIDARELARRAAAWKGDDPIPSDVCLAMLRTAPEGRTEALEQLKKATTEWQRAIRYALGAERVTIGKTASLWIAAARCRAPWSDDAKIENVFPSLGPDAGLAASYSFRCATRSHGHTDLFIHSKPKPPESVDPDCITVILHAQRSVGQIWELGGAGGRTVGSVRWTATVWPQARESFFAAAAFDIADNIDWWEARWQNKAMLEPLLDSGTPLRSMGLLLLAAGLGAKEPGEYGLATDAAIGAIEDGRLGADNFGPMLAQLLPTGLVKPGRWQRTLAEVARVSGVHALVVQQSLQRALCGKLDRMPRDYGKLLELLRELSIDLTQPVTEEPCRAFLAQIKGSGKAAKAAKALLALAPEKASQSGKRLMQQALAARLAAAGRYADR